MKTNITKLAKKIYGYCIRHNIQTITSWCGYAVMYEEWDGFCQRQYTESQLSRAIKRGQQLGLFTQGYWCGVGLTPWAGSARRQRMYNVIIKDEE